MAWNQRKKIWVLCVVLPLIGIVMALVLGGTAAHFIYRYRQSQSVTPLRFNLSNRVQVENAPQLQFGPNPFSISFWFRSTSQQKYLSFISKRISALGDGWVIHAQDNQFLFYTAGCSSPTSAPQPFRDGRWHHLALVRSGNTLAFYYDDAAVGSGPDKCNHNDTNPLKIGMDADKGWHFEGDISEVHIYNRALSLLEVADEWNNGNGRKSAVAGGGLIAGYHFDEGAGAITADFSGNGHNGSLINDPIWAEKKPLR